MCGFVGCIFDFEQQKDIMWEENFYQMNNQIIHRGPDDEGYFFDEYVSFGFRRLSIIDIESGHQPLSYENDRYWIIFNGEIYNYLELREELIKDGLQLETQSDTEVIIAIYSRIRERVVEKLRGMFAFAIWDKQEKELFVARDPFGIKPLFYMEKSDRLFVASEKKSILSILENDRVNQESLQHYLTFQYVPEPLTMTNDIYKLEPGHYMKKRIGEPITIFPYWKVHFQPVVKDEVAHVYEIQNALYDSVEVHMRSDVPVGAFLSGGIDSTFIAAIAKEFNPNLKTFSVGFSHEGFSEVDIAKETASKLGIENISYVVSPEEYMKELPRIMWHMDDPLADPAAIPLYFIAREARKHVTVVLSGEGADELFGGYNIYREPEALKVFEQIPRPINNLLNRVARILPEGVKGKSFIERGTTPIEKRYVGNAKMFIEEEKQLLLNKYKSGIEYTTVTSKYFEQSKGYVPVNQMQYIDIHTWLRGDILLKADKMTMAHSLELRVPFLDRGVFEVAAKIPPELKTASQTTKYVLRKAAEGIVPEHVLHRKKLGFPVPIRYWLKNEMYEWAFNLIQESPTEYLFDKKVIFQLLEDHYKGKRDYSRKLWTLLSFMIWHQVFIEQKYDFTPSMEDKKEAVSLIH
ncbi:asparagine synthase (glutamine-hydrolyzing) [Bacillus kexueae]|uniref:asparagine synthase (glutamine-hydrolyzing) n=1 Tax=Aeribacillus kexueae TaxID=2078952 RepID=UPI001FAFD0E9|nr:asparagine synthase (glutamine-hydrolyzing) [Bacillus kexueae]